MRIARYSVDLMAWVSNIGRERAAEVASHTYPALRWRGIAVRGLAYRYVTRIVTWIAYRWVRRRD
jgi:hypothetical protein